MRVKMSKPTPPAPTASATGPCPTVIKIVGRPGTGSLPSTIKRYARKSIYHGCMVWIEKSVTRDHCSASLGKPRDADQ